MERYVRWGSILNCHINVCFLTFCCSATSSYVFTHVSVHHAIITFRLIFCVILQLHHLLDSDDADSKDGPTYSLVTAWP